ncbi:uncharacterized protein PAC_02554 [Phialocephala subalpina]|uniref:Uncharacterized protein n=1 Tax=Phialocephala subalpina TaxID=576137 RepID=A0A1L7WIS7_9HELO|nr:uncharacterized protein PAC_02554 [Phialocephala subalpina]
MEGDRKDWEGSNIRDQKLEQDISINDQYFWSNRTLQSHLNRMEKLGSEVADMDNLEASEVKRQVLEVAVKDIRWILQICRLRFGVNSRLVPKLDRIPLDPLLLAIWNLENGDENNRVVRLEPHHLSRLKSVLSLVCRNIKIQRQPEADYLRLMSEEEVTTAGLPGHWRLDPPSEVALDLMEKHGKEMDYVDFHIQSYIPTERDEPDPPGLVGIDGSSKLILQDLLAKLAEKSTGYEKVLKDNEMLKKDLKQSRSLVMAINAMLRKCIEDHFSSTLLKELNVESTNSVVRRHHIILDGIGDLAEKRDNALKKLKDALGTIDRFPDQLSAKDNSINKKSTELRELEQDYN